MATVKQVSVFWGNLRGGGEKEQGGHGEPQATYGYLDPSGTSGFHPRTLHGPG